METPIRILHCLPGNMNQGGIENFIMNIYRKIDRNLIQFDFIVHSKEENLFEKEIKALGGKLYRVAYKSQNYKKYVEDMEEILKNHQEYKIMHIHATYGICLPDITLAKKYGLEVIVHAHSSNDILKRKIINFLLKNKVSKEANYKFACSMKAANWLFTKKSIKNNNVTIINNAIESKKFIYNEKIREEQRAKLNLKNKFVIGIVSRLSYLKNIEFLISIFNKIYIKEKNSVLLIVGDGPERKNLEEQVKKMKLENNVIFLGNCSNVNEIIQAIDVFVMPSRCEGFGISLLEAQTAGIKCFTSKDVVPEEIKIKDNENVLEFISLKQDEEIWAEKILAWNKDYKRKNMYKVIMDEGYDLDKNITDIQNKYLEILGEKSNGISSI